MITISSDSRTAIQNVVLKGNIRRLETSMAIGFAIAKNCELPSTKSETPASYFFGTKSEFADCFLSAVNDVAPIDFAAARIYAKKFYELHHFQKFCMCETAPVTGNNLYDMYGFSTYFSGEEIQAMAQVNGLFSSLSKFFAMVVSESDS